ncbi:Cytochrome P450 monooxygenase [Lachnellula hyalina]|uniref:Cytochrome P450 monooxygenase n=1 Tax=Lachnellula hyalina TaxID=1316788 RepID=A0A8H8QWB9_9HELO|nr:Cytochrome P450 monooxygenase [Lachnellula hyalina]TVY22564.1 Cytochrome P450 monooxygenase [Lachnellula hyalina]
MKISCQYCLISIVSNDVDHARIRKTMAHAFSETALREQEPLLKEHITRLIKQLSRRVGQGERVDINEWYNLIAFDVVSDLSFGESLDAIQGGTRHEFIEGFFSACRYQPFFVMAREYRSIGLLLKAMMSIPSFKRVQEMGYQSTKDKVLRRIALKSDTRRDFMTYILRHNDKRGMSEFEIIGSTSVLVNAGGDTTAAALAAITFYLLRDPRVMKQAQDEVRRSFTNREAITSTTLGQITYLNAVIEEAFRIHPPTAGNFARRTGPEGDIIDGHFVPPDVSVGIHQWAATHFDTNFCDPDKFVPERWLPDAPERYKNDIKAASQPWSIGPRNCLGRNLAYLEIRSVLAHILWSFDMELRDESRNWATNQRFDIVWDRPPLYVELKGMQ